MNMLTSKHLFISDYSNPRFCKHCQTPLGSDLHTLTQSVIPERSERDLQVKRVKTPERGGLYGKSSTAKATVYAKNGSKHHSAKDIIREYLEKDSNLTIATLAGYADVTYNYAWRIRSDWRQEKLHERVMSEP